MVFRKWLGAACLVLVGCGGASAEQLKARAAYEMNCPEASLELTDLGDDTMGVNGCGQQLVYLQACQGMGAMRECKWVLNSSSGKDSKSGGSTVSE